MDINWQKTYWDKLSRKGNLSSVMDPNDTSGYKNYRLDKIQKIKLGSFFSSLRIGRVEKILDFGAGLGRNYKFLTSFADQYVGVDISKGMLDEARKKAKRLNDEFILIADNHLPMNDNNVDIIFAFWVLQHICDDIYLTELIREFYRITKKGGYVVICERSSLKRNEDGMDERYILRRSPSEYASLFGNGGFRLAKTKIMNYKFKAKKLFSSYDTEGENIYAFQK
jgi:ubiquinone/menaquinone biosynthesis C-methylase UbiE